MLRLIYIWSFDTELKLYVLFSLDVSKPLSTPVAKKPISSPLTRPAPTKTTKSDTPKLASTVKAESASKKPTTPSKAGRR